MGEVVAQNGTPSFSEEKVNKIKNKRMKRKLKNKENKKLKKQKIEETQQKKKGIESDTYEDADINNSDIIVEYVPSNPLDEYEKDDSIYQEFSHIFSKFMGPTNNKDVTIVEGEDEVEDSKEDEKVEEQPPKLSKKKRRLAKRIDIGVLKQLTRRPDLVEIHDCSAADPIFLMHLKAYRNAPPVPRHWSVKRKYLQGKRGIEKPTYELPSYIRQTGISEARQSLLEQDAEKKLRQKQRERLQPKMGRMDIDYSILYDAFFIHQTKPQLSIHGDMYYEGKEHEVKLKEKTPGILSEELRSALGMPEGTPPPWLINMQRYGPPPSYPKLKVPGVNAPLPPGAQPGYHPGGWGAPPVDEYGRPIWGWIDDIPPTPDQASIDKTYLWGTVQRMPEEEEEEDIEQEMEEEEGMEVEDIKPPVPEPEELAVEVPSSDIELRKYTKDANKYIDQEIISPKELYKVLPQKETSVSGSVVGSEHLYDLGKNQPPPPSPPHEPSKTTKPEPKKAEKKKEKFKF